MGRDVKRLKAKGRGKVSNFFSSQIPDQYHISSCMMHVTPIDSVPAPF